MGALLLLFIFVALDGDPYTDPYEILFMLLLIYAPLSVMSFFLARGKGERVIPWIMISISVVLIAFLVLIIFVQYAILVVRPNSSLHVSSLFLPVLVFIFVAPPLYTLLVLYIMGYGKDIGRKAVYKK